MMKWIIFAILLATFYATTNLFLHLTSGLGIAVVVLLDRLAAKLADEREFHQI